jgi:excisionase family DNA binding protein
MPVQITSDDEFLTLEEAAELLSVNKRWMRRAIDRRELPYVKMRGLVRIPRRAIDAYIRKQTVRPMTDPIPTRRRR